MKLYYYSLQMIRLGDWLIKASSYDDQILIFTWNEATMEQKLVMFYNEETAHNYIESLLKNDRTNC